MLSKRISSILLFISIISVFVGDVAKADGGLKAGKGITLATPKMALVIDYSDKVSISSLTINGQKVISNADGIFTSLKVKGKDYSSLHLKTNPVAVKTKSGLIINNISYGDQDLTINETWTFTTLGNNIKWNIKRTLSKATEVEEAGSPVFTFNSMDTWEGAYHGYGGLAWFYLFNRKIMYLWHSFQIFGFLEQ